LFCVLIDNAAMSTPPNNRRDEPPGRHLRSSRCVLTKGRWFIVTREGIDVGPYEQHDDAQRDAKLLAMMLDSVDDPKIAGIFIREFARRVRAQESQTRA
jgi:hypothetical protein